MLINPDHLKCVSFLYVDTKEGGLPAATVLFVSYPYHDGEVYGLTAKHGVRGEDTFIRFNRKNGKGYEDVPVSAHDWQEYPDNDIAVLPLRLDTKDYDFRPIEDRDIAHEIASQHEHTDVKAISGSELEVSTEPLGVGNEVYTVGLFQGHPGEQLTHPVVRFGNIALVPRPGEKIGFGNAEHRGVRRDVRAD